MRSHRARSLLERKPNKLELHIAETMCCAACMDALRDREMRERRRIFERLPWCMDVQGTWGRPSKWVVTNRLIVSTHILCPQITSSLPSTL